MKKRCIFGCTSFFGSLKWCRTNSTPVVSMHLFRQSRQVRPTRVAIEWHCPYRS